MPLQESIEKPLGPDRAMSLRETGRYFAMRLMPWISTRRLIARTLALAVGRTERRASASDAERAVEPIIDTLNRRGWTPLAPLLAPEQVNEMLAFLADSDLISPDGRRFRASDAPANVHMGSYPLEAVLRCPHVAEFMNRPDILRIATGYLGCKPTISGLRVDWSRPSGQSAADVQQFHRDNDDWKQVKLFMYLTDVDDQSGPHEFIATSHLGSGRWRARPYPPEQLRREYGAENFVRVKGPTGTCFMVDTWGVHKGNIPVTRPRLLLQVQYSILPIVNFDYRPMALPTATNHDRYTNRLLVSPLSQ